MLKHPLMSLLIVPILGTGILLALPAQADQITAATNSDVESFELEFVPGTIQLRNWVLDPEAGGYVETNGGAGVALGLKAHFKVRIGDLGNSDSSDASVTKSLFLIDPAIDVGANIDASTGKVSRKDLRLGEVGFVYINKRYYSENQIKESEAALGAASGPYKTFDFLLAKAGYRNTSTPQTRFSTEGLSTSVAETSFHTVGRIKGSEVVLGICGTARFNAVFGKTRIVDQSLDIAYGPEGEVCVEVKVSDYVQVRNIFGAGFLYSKKGNAWETYFKNRVEVSVLDIPASLNYEFRQDYSSTETGPTSSLATHYFTVAGHF